MMRMDLIEVRDRQVIRHDGESREPRGWRLAHGYDDGWYFCLNDSSNAWSWSHGGTTEDDAMIACIARQEEEEQERKDAMKKGNLTRAEAVLLAGEAAVLAVEDENCEPTGRGGFEGAAQGEYAGRSAARTMG